MLRRAEAEGERASADAAAALERASADAAAARERARAESTRASADAAAARERASAESTRASAEAASSKRWGVLFYAGLSAAGALAVDWVLHDSPDFIKWRMAAQLRACRVPASAVAVPMPNEFRLPQIPFELQFLPTMILAPSGAGKSTLLAKIAREAAMPADASRSPAPVVLVRLRQTPSVDRSVQASVKPVDSQEIELADACAQLDATATRVYAQIGFPTRRSLLQSLLDRGITLSAGDSKLHLHKASVTTSRLVDALNTLFEVCAQLRQERLAAGMSLQDAAPVLLFDEVQDLIRDERLARVGGVAIFNTVAKLLVTYGVDENAVRTAVTGSSALLSVCFERTVASGGRWCYYELPDPKPEVVVLALQGREYTDVDAKAMVELCGTRLRLLEVPLKSGKAAVDARAFMDSACKTADAHLLDALGTDPAVSRSLLATLNAVAQHEAGKRAEPPTLGAAFTARQAEAASKVLYVRRDRSLTFQSPLYADAWSRKGASLIAAAKMKL